jgi:hypothetical protein
MGQNESAITLGFNTKFFNTIGAKRPFIVKFEFVSATKDNYWAICISRCKGLDKSQRAGDREDRRPD